MRIRQVLISMEESDLYMTRIGLFKISPRFLDKFSPSLCSSSSLLFLRLLIFLIVQWTLLMTIAGFCSKHIHSPFCWWNWLDYLWSLMPSLIMHEGNLSHILSLLSLLLHLIDVWVHPLQAWDWVVTVREWQPLISRSWPDSIR